MFSPPPGGATEYIAYRTMRYMDFARATINRDIFIPGPTQCGLSRSLKQAKHTTFYKFEEGISFAEHWKLVPESSEFHLTLKRAHRVHFFQLEIRQKKRDILSAYGACFARSRTSGRSICKTLRATHLFVFCQNYFFVSMCYSPTSSSVTILLFFT